jgi:hypothetical protein
VLQAKERAPTPSPSAIVTFGLAIESIKELRGASFWAIDCNLLNAVNYVSYIQDIMFRPMLVSYGILDQSRGYA